MTAPNHLEQQGTFASNPFAELLVEIVQARFSGSLRVSTEKLRSIIYFREGQIVYAVSNAKSLRLFNVLLRKMKIDAKLIAKHPNFANDVEFSAALVSAGVLSKEEIDAAFIEQMSDIVVDVLNWPAGDWVFSPLVRARADLCYSIDAYQILIDYARCAGTDQVIQRFRSVEESFGLAEAPRAGASLQPHESAVLECFSGRSLSIQQLRSLTSMPDSGLFHAIYVLWLGGLIVRKNWNSAFSAVKLGEILSARVSKVRDAAAPVELPAAVPAENPAETPAASETEPVKLPEIEISLEQYLQQIEKAETHYDSLGVAVDADNIQIKNAYFSLAKQFHPDRYHRESDEMLKRIQSAFTVLAHAHETLRTRESREAYNSKMYKELEAREKRRAAGQPDTSTDPAARHTEQGLESFEEGLNMLNEEEYEAAAAYLARAVHYSPQNALYHAYFGKALAGSEEKHRHKAEAELQTAAKLDPKNPKIRMMLVEFLVEQNMLRRAEGELKRFLEMVPGNREATEMLAKLKQ